MAGPEDRIEAVAATEIELVLSLQVWLCALEASVIVLVERVATVSLQV